MNFGFLLLDLGDVRKNENVIARLAVGVGDGSDTEHFGEFFSILAPVLDFTTPECPGVQFKANTFAELLLLFAAAQQLECGLPDGFIVRSNVDPFDGSGYTEVVAAPNPDGVAVPPVAGREPS